MRKTALVLNFCALFGLTGRAGAAAPTTVQVYDFAALPEIGVTSAKERIRLGGFSGLVFTGIDKASGEYQFVTLTDRGPNSEPTVVGTDGQARRGFVLPEFVPEIIRFTLAKKSATLKITQRLPLSAKAGKRLVGLPVRPGDPERLGDDETGVDLSGGPLAAAPLGIDPEALAVASDGTYWIGEEYYPSILHVDAKGVLLERFIPQGARPAEATTEALPADLLARKANRGFEGLALQGTKIYAFVQSPLALLRSADGKPVPHSDFGRVVVFDTVTKTTIAQYLYPFDGPESDKIGDATVAPDGTIWVIERNDKLGNDAKKKIYALDFSKATNIHNLATPPELLTVADRQAKGIVAAAKTLVVDLVTVGLTRVEKLEGLAAIDASAIAVVNDDDFGLKVEFDPKTGKLDPRTSPPEGEHLFLIQRH